MIKIRFAENCDKEFWYTLDKHLPDKEFDKKVRDKMGYIILEGENPIGVLRYNLFWDNTPFLTLIFINWPYQKKGFGCKAMNFWEREMKEAGYGNVYGKSVVMRF